MKLKALQNTLSLRFILSVTPACLFLAKGASQGLEHIIVEEYFVYESTCTEIEGLPEGAITYRIFVDLEPEYRLQSVYGVQFHPFRLETSTYFYNHRLGAILGDGLSSTLADSMAYMLDSYLTLGPASDSHWGVMLSDDEDGSILDKRFFSESDGLYKAMVPDIVYYELENDVFIPQKASLFESNNFLIGAFGGVSGPTDENRVLIAQLTTDGELSFEINIQIARPGEKPIQFTARKSTGDAIQFDDLSYGLKKEMY